MFVDADTIVYRDFLAAAISLFEENPTIGGINGWIDDTDENGVPLLNVESRSEQTVEAKWLRGPCCFYRRAALLEVGSFHPFIKVEEEAELGLRLVKKGWRLQIIPLPMACHTRCYHQQTAQSVISTFKRDVVSKRLGEVTNTIAHAFREGNGLAFCWLRLNTTIVFFGWLSVTFLALLLPAFVYPKTVFAVLLISGLMMIALKKRDLTQSWAFILNKIFVLIDLLCGIHRIESKKPNLYPLDFIERN